LNEFADKKVKVVVVGNPANTNAMICSHFAPNIPKTNFTALTRLDQNRAVFQVAQKLATNNRNVSNIIIWGNHSSTQVPDLRFGLVQNLPTDLITTSARS
jgi:malate dehydrogenase